MSYELPSDFLVDLEARIAAELVGKGRALSHNRKPLASQNFVQLAAMKKALENAPWSATEAALLQRPDITVEQMIDEAAELVLLEFLELTTGDASVKIVDTATAAAARKFTGRKAAAQHAYDAFVTKLRVPIGELSAAANFLDLSSGVTVDAVELPSGEEASAWMSQRFVEAQADVWLRYSGHLLSVVRRDLLQRLTDGNPKTFDPSVISDPITDFWNAVDRRDHLHYESAYDAFEDASNAASIIQERLDASSVDFVREIREQLLNVMAEHPAFADLRFVYQHGQLSRPIAAVVEQTLLSSNEPIIDGHTFGAPLGDLLETPEGRSRICRISGVKPTELKAVLNVYADQVDRVILQVTPAHTTPQATAAAAFAEPTLDTL